MKNGAGTGGHDGNSGPLGRHDACEHAGAGQEQRRADRLPEHDRRPEDGEQRLGELDLADAGHAAAGEARVPGEEAEEHGEGGDVGEAEPGVGGGREVGERDRGDRYRDRERER